MIQISHDGSPVHPSIGQRFILVHPIDRSNPGNGNGLVYEDQLTIGITVGYHGREIPKDRIPEFLYGSTVKDNIELLRDLILVIINSSYSDLLTGIITNYNNSIKVLPSDIQVLLDNKINIIDKFKYLSSDASPILRYPDYFGSEQLINEEPRPAGYTLTTVFRCPKMIVSGSC